MSDFNFFEHSVEEKAEGKRRMVKILGRAALIGIVVAYVAITFIIKMPMLAIIAMVMLPVILTLWKRFNCEFKYVIEGANMTFYYVYFASKKPKEILKVVIKDFREIAPRTAESDAKIKAEGYNKVDILNKLMANGLLTLTAGPGMRLLPPLAITYEEMDQGLAIMKKVLG
jgi:hypothetical protein